MWLGLKKNSDLNSQQPPHRHKAAHSSGGFNLSYGENNSDTQNITANILKQIGSKIMTGNFGSLLQISKPIAICTDSSFLHGIANGNTYCYLLEQCNSLSNIEQIKYICTYYIAGLHVDNEIVKMKAPLDPLIGETLQLISLDGSEFYAEQVNFDPPQCYYQILGKNYKIQGVESLEINIHKTVNSLTGVQKGKFTCTFADGKAYKCTIHPTMEVGGLMMGDRILNWSGKAQIDGPGIRAVINFNYNTEGILAKFTSFFKTQEQAKIFDIVEIDIYELDQNGQQMGSPIIQGIGSWLEGLLFGDKVYWQMSEDKPKWISPTVVLESDTTNRYDLKYMRLQNMQDAQKAKIELETHNHKDTELRRRRK